MDPKRLFFVVLLPATACAIGLLIAWRPFLRRRPEAKICLWAGGPALGVGLLLSAYFTLGKWPSLAMPREGKHWLEFKPSQAAERLPYLVILAMLVALFPLVTKSWKWPYRIGGMLLAGAVPLLSMHTKIVRDFTTAESLAWIGGIALTLIVIWQLADRLASRTEGPILPIAWWACAAGAAAIEILMKTAKHAELHAGLAGCLGACVVIAAWRRDLRLERGFTLVFVLFYEATLIATYWYAAVSSLPPILLLAVAPLGAWVGRAKPIRRLKPAKRSVVQLAGVLIPIAGAIGFALRDRPPSSPY